MLNKNGKRVRDESPAKTAESVVADQRFKRGSSPTHSSSSFYSCLSTTEEKKEEVASSWIDEEPSVLVLVGCRRCLMYTMVMQKTLRCLNCKCNDQLILF
ncbi:hypothetical protein BRARA_D00582 [Brassica rapa]|uniref:BnaA04g05350D protein n=4 Tax=Brassica TaxID=3705 RepID=A0A078GCZ6_BRANA|nr:protein GL2-INTERACTING REPRESSOR 2-like [Brassica napus]KAG5400598.1 hypothetical protein IGI04_015205 [Brassica rapa subsp. trilocularis]RID65384.1 hypothetical protein BRARA_D00582 [Brassica rapa]KAH0928711.1 hypothetical protein HID58_014438 [Brassica napus]CAF2268405.1 unnamed protein product [Brassica napus]CAG7905855.1 unnamed protein product [Brassica rapa]